MGRCILCIEIRLLLLCVPLFLHFSFSPIFKIDIFRHIFSGTVRPRRLKLGTHVDSRQMYRFYRNQVIADYSSLYCSFFFLSNCQTLKCFVKHFSGTVRPSCLKLVTHEDIGRMYRVYRHHVAALISPFIFSFFFPLRKRLRIRSVISVNYHYITVLWPFNLLIRFKRYNIVQNKL